jgi:transposase
MSAQTHWYCLVCDRTKQKNDMHVKPSTRRGICRTCHNKGHRMSDQPQQQQQQQQQLKQLEFLSHRDTDTQRMNMRQRNAIITLHQNGDTIDEICMKVGCVKSTVYRWLNKYDTTHELNDDKRGEQRSLKYDEVDTVIHTAKTTPFTTPKGNYSLDLSLSHSLTHSLTLSLSHSLSLSLRNQTQVAS